MSDDAGFEVVGAGEFVVKTRLQDILTARQEALDAIDEAAVQKRQASRDDTPELITDVRINVASKVRRYAREASSLIGYSEDADEIWEDRPLGHWSMRDPLGRVTGQPDEVLAYYLDGVEVSRADAQEVTLTEMGVEQRRPEPPSVDIVGLDEYMEWTPSATISVEVEILPNGVQSPEPEVRRVSVDVAPPVDLSDTAVEALDDVLDESGVADIMEGAEIDAGPLK